MPCTSSLPASLARYTGPKLGWKCKGYGGRFLSWLQAYGHQPGYTDAAIATAHSDRVVFVGDGYGGSLDDRLLREHQVLRAVDHWSELLDQVRLTPTALKKSLERKRWVTELLEERSRQYTYTHAN